jgi:hypothetical protein
MLVEPRKNRDGDLTGCTGATMEDGTVYRANRNGLMHVESDAHATAMVKNPLAPGHVVEQKFSGARVAGVTCGSCGFGGFVWQASAPCPRCGSDDWLSDIKGET